MKYLKPHFSLWASAVSFITAIAFFSVVLHYSLCGIHDDTLTGSNASILCHTDATCQCECHTSKSCNTTLHETVLVTKSNHLLAIAPFSFLSIVPCHSFNCSVRLACSVRLGKPLPFCLRILNLSFLSLLVIGFKKPGG